MTARDPKERRDPSAIPHITIDQRGGCYCERCGATYRATEDERRRFDMTRSRAFMAQHRECRPKVYVS